MNDAQSSDEELLRKLDSAASPEVSGMLNRYFVAALCESAAARLRFKDAAIDNLAAEVQRLREWEAFAAHEIATLKSSLQYLREERRWIPVEEGLPEDEADVICGYAGFKSFPGSRQGFNWFDERDSHLAFPPTHWQPLPAPPAKEAE